MRKLILGLVLAITATAAYAACSTHTYFIDGKMKVCTVCCSYGNCTTSCI